MEVVETNAILPISREVVLSNFIFSQNASFSNNYSLSTRCAILSMLHGLSLHLFFSRDSRSQHLEV